MVQFEEINCRQSMIHHHLVMNLGLNPYHEVCITGTFNLLMLKRSS